MISRLLGRGDPRRQLAAERRLRDAIVAQRHFLFVRVEESFRAIELLANGAIGRGASETEQSWTVGWRHGRAVVRIAGKRGAACQLALEDTGALRGHWIKEKKKQVLLLPEANGSPFKPKISFFTTCMGRLHHLRETLPANLRAAASYGNVEFVVLNYNSPDQLDDWARDQLAPHVASGLVGYYKTTEPAVFSPGKSRNIAALVATGDILCNVDADNFLGHGFAEHLAQLMHAPRTVVRPDRNRGGVSGRLAMYRSDFLALGGYDESFEGFGWDELDLFDRARADGFVARRFDAKYALCLSHSHAEREQHIGIDKNVTNERNRRQSVRNIKQRILAANAGKAWGQATLVRNFNETIHVGVQPSAAAQHRVPAPHRAGRLVGQNI